MTRTRLLLVLLSAVLSGLLAAASAVLGGADDVTARSAPAERTAALALLREWDRARADVWRSGDPDALRALYVPGSATGRADRAVLAAYAERGLRVTGMRMQRAEVSLASATADRVVLLVTDRLVGATAVGRRARVRLPRDGWSRRRIVMVRVAGDWRVSEVRDQVSIVASTDSTSGSRKS